MAAGNEQRGGEDRRATEVSHMTLYEKQLEHDQDIIEIKRDIRTVKEEVHGVREELLPISQGITSMVFLFKLAIGLGALAAAGIGVIEFWEILHGT